MFNPRGPYRTGGRKDRRPLPPRRRHPRNPWETEGKPLAEWNNGVPDGFVVRKTDPNGLLMCWDDWHPEPAAGHELQRNHHGTCWTCGAPAEGHN